MKKTIQSLALVLALALSFTACKKDDDANSGTLTYDGKSYDTKYALLETSSTGSYANLVISNVDINTATSGTVTGIDLLVDFTTPKAGTYTYKDDSESDYDGTKNFFDATAFVELKLPDMSSGLFESYITAGTVTISQDGSTYTVDYDLDFDGKKITGKYVGAIKVTKAE